MTGRLARGVARRLRRLLYGPADQRHGLVGASSQWRMKRAFQMEFLQGMELQPDHYLADLGCGTFRGGIPLIQYLDLGHYYGIEVREEVLEEARQELAGHDLAWKQPQLILVDDLAGLKLDRRFDFVWAFSVLIHMPDEILASAMRFVSHHLADGGSFLANVNIGKPREASWQGFPVMWRESGAYRAFGERVGLSLEDLGSLEELGHRSGDEAQDAQRMLRYTRSAPNTPSERPR